MSALFFIYLLLSGMMVGYGFSRNRPVVLLLGVEMIVIAIYIGVIR